jgi:DNA polymerase III sliding clamp (beta) subunit (PCNA family)
MQTINVNAKIFISNLYTIAKFKWLKEIKFVFENDTVKIYASSGFSIICKTMKTDVFVNTKTICYICSSELKEILEISGKQLSKRPSKTMKISLSNSMIIIDEKMTVYNNDASIDFPEFINGTDSSLKITVNTKDFIAKLKRINAKTFIDVRLSTRDGELLISLPNTTKEINNEDYRLPCFGAFHYQSFSFRLKPLIAILSVCETENIKIKCEKSNSDFYEFSSTDDNFCFRLISLKTN